MGLDISAYSKIEAKGFLDDTSEWDGYSAWSNPHFPHALPPGHPASSDMIFTVTGESHSFRAGSYSGYGLFRSTLSQYAKMGDSFDHALAEEFWDNIDNHKDKPFWELINFSDCEGMFYGPVCEKLHNDFVEHRDAYRRFIRSKNPYPGWEGDEFFKKYDNFGLAFKLAADNGLVDFH